jgi:hypothetical protein
MARINIPLDALTSRLNLSSRFDSVRSQSIAQRFAGLKPVTEFFDVKRISKPKDFGEVSFHSGNTTTHDGGHAREDHSRDIS